MTLRLGITGTHGVGKTTLATNLSHRLNIPLIKEKVRDIADMWGLHDANDIFSLPKTDLAEFEYECFMAQQEAEKKHRFVTDRTLLDYYVYAHLFGVPLSRFGIDPYDIVRKYDIIIYVPQNIPLVGDGFRSLDMTMRIEVDESIRSYLSSLGENVGLEVFEITSDDKDGRVEEVVEYLYTRGYL